MMQNQKNSCQFLYCAGIRRFTRLCCVTAASDSPRESSAVVVVQELTHATGHHESLTLRGSVTNWFDPEMDWVPPLPGKRGRKP